MADRQKFNLLEMPWTDVADWLKAGNDVVMIPVGSMEKHGHHVPLGELPTAFRYVRERIEDAIKVVIKVH